MPKVREKAPGVKRTTLSLRATPDLLARLDAAIAANGRSLAQELENRVEQTFQAEDALGGSRTAPILRAMADMIKHAEAKTGESWLDDYATWQVVSRAVVRTLNSWEPEPPNIEAIRKLNRQIEEAEARVDQNIAAVREFATTHPVPEFPETASLEERSHNLAALDEASKALKKVSDGLIEASTERDRLRAEREAVAAEARSALIRGALLAEEIAPRSAQSPRQELA